MADDVAPALTPEEWAARTSGRDPADFGDYDAEVFLRLSRCGPPGSEYERIDLVVETGDNGLGSPVVVEIGDCHALAALALHRQPFGFTQADVDLLNDPYGSAEGLSPRPERFHELARRIAALLPPR